VLLLRGAQTPGELKQRTERWHSFRSLDDLEETLQRFAEKGTSVNSNAARPKGIPLGEPRRRTGEALVA